MKLYFLILLASLFSVCQGQIDKQDGEELFKRFLSAQERGDFLGAQSRLDTLLMNAQDLSPYHLALVLNNYGLVNWKLGKFEEASDCYQKSLDLCTGNDDTFKRLRVVVYNNLGILAKESGAYPRALEYIENAENEIARFASGDRWYYKELSMIELNKALILMDLLRFYEAIDLLNKSLKEKILYDLPYIGSGYLNLALIYEKLDNPDESEQYFLKSISQWTREFGPDHFELGRVYREYGALLAEKGNKAGADLYFQKAIDNYLTNYGPNHPYMAHCFRHISKVKYAGQEYKEALVFAQKALISICPEFESEDIFSNPLALEATLDLGLLKNYNSKIKALKAYAEELSPDSSRLAADYLKLALETSEETVKVLSRIQDTYMTQESRLFFTNNQKDIFIQGIEIALKLNALTGEDQYNEKAYAFAALGKTLEFNYEKRLKEVLYLNNLQDSAARELISIRNDIEAYSHMIEYEQTRTNPDSSSLNTWKQSRFSLRREYDSLHEIVFGSKMEFEVRDDPFSPELLQNLQAKIKRNQCLVEYSVSGMKENGKGKLFTFIINRKNLSVYSSITDSSFCRNIEQVQNSLREYNPYEKHSNDWSKLELALTRLSNVLIDPYASIVRAKKLTIIPDEELIFVPFDALIQSSSRNTQREKGTNYLIKNHEISMISNSFMLDHTRTFRLKQPRVKIISQDYGRTLEGGLDHLSLVSEETEAILNTIEGSRIPDSLSKQNILKEISEADLLHFALHLFPSNEDHSSSYMVLRQENDSAFSNLLFDYEIDPLELSSPLVVINACESGSGQFHRGEGMLSLSRSFLLAGAKSVISALWPIDDKAGSSIMIKFYENLSRGNSKSKALRKAKLSYLEEAKPSFSHPYYWAGYQLMGNNSAVFINRKLLWTGVSGILILISVFLWRRKQIRAKN